MRVRTASFVCMVIAAAATGAWAADEDMLRDAIDPYNLARERARFIAAAGADSDLDASEFEANASVESGFARSFDKWPNLLAFDRSRDGRIDWTEAQMYRRALRSAVFNQYDVDRDGRLEGEERRKAIGDLAAGRVPKLDAPAVAVAPASPPGDSGQRRVQRFDGLGRDDLAAGELRRQEFNRQILARYDRDGDGRLSEAERQAMDPRARAALRFQDLLLPHFDADGDGALSASEQEGVLGFAQQLRAVGEQWRLGLVDLNNDGIVSPDEERQVQQQFQAAAFQLLPKLVAWNDTNGDGQVDEQERLAAFRNVTQTAERKFETWTRQYDADGDGRLSDTERAEMIQGVRRYYEELYRSHDTDGTGRLDTAQTAAFLEALAGEFGVKPARFQ